MDVNGDSFVSPIDVLQVINWINDPTKQRFLTLGAATGNPPYIDVNGDGIVSAIDVSLIITHLNNRPASGEGEFSAEDDGDFLVDFASSANTVLASDWAAGLETMLQPRRERAESGSNEPADLAILADSEEDNRLVTTLASSADLAVDDYWAELGDQAGPEDAGQQHDAPHGLHDLVLDDLLS